MPLGFCFVEVFDGGYWMVAGGRWLGLVGVGNVVGCGLVFDRESGSGCASGWEDWDGGCRSCAEVVVSSGLGCALVDGDASIFGDCEKVIGVGNRPKVVSLVGTRVCDPLF
jgi:hypothetical protein